jgi:hypothetical protein
MPDRNLDITARAEHFAAVFRRAGEARRGQEKGEQA